MTKCIPQITLGRTYFPDCKITYEPLQESLLRLGEPLFQSYIKLHELAKHSPKLAKAKVEDLLKENPKIPELYNLLSYIYIRLKKIKKAEKLIKENYSQNPNNIFAKINFADQCLRKNKAHLITSIFENITLLTQLYPDKKIFHYSEALGFACLMSFYYLKIKDRERSIDYWHYAQLIDPDDPAVLLLSRKIQKSNFLLKMADLLRTRKA